MESKEKPRLGDIWGLFWISFLQRHLKEKKNQKYSDSEYTKTSPTSGDVFLYGTFIIPMEVVCLLARVWSGRQA